MSITTAAPGRSTARFTVALPAALFLILGAFAAVFLLRSHPADEVAVVIAVPAISVLAAVTVLAYVLDILLMVRILRMLKKSHWPKIGHNSPMKLEFQLTAPWEAILFSLPLATSALAFLIMTGLLSATRIEWAMPGMALMTIGLSIGTGLAFLYRLARRILNRTGAGHQMASRMILSAYRFAVTFLWSVGVARGLDRT